MTRVLQRLHSQLETALSSSLKLVFNTKCTYLPWSILNSNKSDIIYTRHYSWYEYKHLQCSKKVYVCHWINDTGYCREKHRYLVKLSISEDKRSSKINVKDKLAYGESSDTYTHDNTEIKSVTNNVNSSHKITFRKIIWYKLHLIIWYGLKEHVNVISPSILQESGWLIVRIQEIRFLLYQFLLYQVGTLSVIIT